MASIFAATAGMITMLGGGYYYFKQVETPILNPTVNEIKSRKNAGTLPTRDIIDDLKKFDISNLKPVNERKLNDKKNDRLTSELQVIRKMINDNKE